MNRPPRHVRSGRPSTIIERSTPVTWDDGSPLLPGGSSGRRFKILSARRRSGDQQPTGPPPAGQVGMLMMGTQLTDVVETANASSSANKTFFPLVMTEKRTSGRGFRPRFPRTGSAAGA